MCSLDVKGETEEDIWKNYPGRGMSKDKGLELVEPLPVLGWAEVYVTGVGGAGGS